MRNLNTQDRNFLDHCCEIVQPTAGELDMMYAEEQQRLHKRPRRPDVDFDMNPELRRMK